MLRQGPLLLVFVAGALAAADIVSDVRTAVDRNDLARADREITEYRTRQGATPEMVEALSWLARGALNAKEYEKAVTYASQTRGLAVTQLKTRKLDAEPHLSIALGAAIEVQAQALTARGERARALAFLRLQQQAWGKTSIATRIQKNINLLKLEGKPAPALEIGEWLGSKPEPLERLRGRPVLLFFWAHWCGDCKAEVPILARIVAEYGRRGLVLIGPTQHYGYTAEGDDAAPAQETRYIDQVRKQYYAALGMMPVPVSEANFRNYGASTTPTLVLLDRTGVVRLYHPGAMSYGELADRIKQVLLN